MRIRKSELKAVIQEVITEANDMEARFKKLANITIKQ